MDMRTLRCYSRTAIAFVLVFGSAAVFDLFLLTVFPLRQTIGPWLIQQLSRLFLKVARVHIRHTGRQRAADGRHPTLILSNHLSFLDIIVLSATFRAVFVSKQEVRAWPVIGALAWLAGIRFLDRASMSKRVSLLKALAVFARPGTVTCVFPQGTTSSRIENRPFLKGVFKVVEINPAIRLLPVTLDYREETEMVWQRGAFMDHLFSVLSLPQIHVHLTAHPVVTIGAYDRRGVREVAQWVERTVKAPLLNTSVN